MQVLGPVSRRVKINLQFDWDSTIEINLKIDLLRLTLTLCETGPSTKSI